MIANVRKDLSVDKKTLVRMTFERESPEANTPTIEVVFQYNEPDTYNLSDLKPGVLVLLSVTRTDTRKPITLTPEEEMEVFQRASEYASEILS